MFFFFLAFFLPRNRCTPTNLGNGNYPRSAPSRAPKLRRTAAGLLYGRTGAWQPREFPGRSSPAGVGSSAQ